jgi:hypothetical protein
VNIESFAKLLQFSISPIALISGASLLLLTVTNRLGRTIDRSRILVREMESTDESKLKEDHRSQLQILLRRSRYLRNGVLCISATIFLAAVMTLCVILQVFAAWELTFGVLACLFLGVVSLSAAIVFLFFDVSTGLKAMEVEVRRHI